MEEVLVPLGFFAVIPAIVWAVTSYRFKRQKESVKLLTAMTDKGQEITPEIIRTLGIQQRPKHADLRYALFGFGA